MQFVAISKMDLDLYLNHSNANITSNMIPKAKVLQKNSYNKSFVVSTFTTI